MILRQYIQICKEAEQKAKAEWEAKPWYEKVDWGNKAIGNSKLPNQGTVSNNSEAPPVDAGKQGKHVAGHNNYDPTKNKSLWPNGSNGVSETQEAWLKGVPKKTGIPMEEAIVKTYIRPDGVTIEVHMDKRGFIHGYPVN